MQYKWRISSNGVPHIVVRNSKGKQLSLCYMGKKRIFRVFTNYASKGLNQERFDFDNFNAAWQHARSLLR